MKETKGKIKILNVLTYIGDGGLEMLVYRIYSGLDKNKYDLEICTMLDQKDNFLTENFRNVCGNIISLDFINKNPGIFDFLKNIKQFFILAAVIRKGKYDIVHSHDFFAAFITRLAVILNKITFSGKPSKVFITYHNIYYWLKPLHHFLNRILSIFTTNIICVTRSVMEYSLEKEKINKNKFKVIYNGVNSEEFYPDDKLRNEQRELLGYKNDDFVICNVGVYSVRKGQIYLLKAYNELRKKYNNLKLVLVGSVREHEIEIYNEMIDFVKNNNLGNSVKFLGTTKEVNKIYNMIDLFVMCSITEGFGLAAYEAMLTEKVCIFSDIPPFLELIKNGENGYIFKNRDYESLIDKINDILTNVNNLNVMGKKVRKYVEENLSEKNMINEYNNVYSFNI